MNKRNNDNIVLYMMVTLDEIELPLFVTENIKELSLFSGRKVNSIKTLCSEHGKRRTSFVRVVVPAGDEI